MTWSQLIQVISLAGSMLILGAYAASQFGRLRPSTLLYAALNLIGSAILTVIAVIESQWGFLLLEGVWALISLWAIVKLARGKQSNAGH